METKMSFEPDNMMLPDVAEELHRSYSLDQIKSLLSQAAGIAEQEGMSALNELLLSVTKVAENCVC
jgi:D-mannonate dehydratase